MKYNNFSHTWAFSHLYLDKKPACVVYRMPNDVSLVMLYASFITLAAILPDTEHCAMYMRRVCRESFPRQRLPRKPPVSNYGMYHGTCVTHVPSCMSGLVTRGGRENVPGISGACATSDLKYLVRGPLCERNVTCDGIWTLNRSGSTGVMLYYVRNSMVVISFSGDEYVHQIRYLFIWNYFL